MVNQLAKDFLDTFLENTTASFARGCTMETSLFYLPIKVKTAAPTARRPVITFGIARPNNDKPKRRKNNIVHQTAIDRGTFIFILL